VISCCRIFFILLMDFLKMAFVICSMTREYVTLLIAKNEEYRQ